MALSGFIALATVLAVSKGSHPGQAVADEPSDTATLVRNTPVHIAPGPFQPNWDSLKQYRCPTWFRDAKFGIWAHWTAQCVPEQGDWYARNMYIQGSPDYNYHVAHYGHPSKFGFKDIDHIWHAEHWDPEKLIQLYKRAGARYFVALANHHDNFDCWNSTFQPWNSVRVGPHKDIVGTWARVAREHGLRFGVTVHSARAWDWFDVAHDSDRTGPLKGVPYDGVLTKADGKGTWWEGLDPADLYGPAGSARTPEAFELYVKKWFLRTQDLVDKYHPDLLYFDDSRLPLGWAGLSIAAHFYNSNRALHGGKLEAVLTTKDMPEDLRSTVVWDIERGRSDRIEPYPWQTDTCIGDWHYRRSLYEHHAYKKAAQVVPMLVDIVSKNGNLLLNIPVRGDGTIDDDEIAFCEDMARWIKVNGECIYGTRPWIVYGEGPTRLRGGSFNEGAAKSYTSADIRFTTKGPVLYAIALGWPADGKLVIHSLAKVGGAKGRVTSVTLLGHRGHLSFEQNAEGLVVRMPAEKPCDYAYALRITGTNLRDFHPELAPQASAPSALPDAHGNVELLPDQADLRGRLQVEQRGDVPNIGFWDDPNDQAVWNVRGLAPGAYEITARCASLADTDLAIGVAGHTITAHLAATGSWDDYRTISFGTVQIERPGTVQVVVRAADPTKWKPVNLQWVRMVRVKSVPGSSSRAKVP